MDEHDPKAGQVWRHVNDAVSRYHILIRATNKDPDGPTDGIVVYHPEGRTEHYVRTVEHFRARFVYVQATVSSRDERGAGGTVDFE